MWNFGIYFIFTDAMVTKMSDKIGLNREIVDLT